MARPGKYGLCLIVAMTVDVYKRQQDEIVFEIRAQTGFLPAHFSLRVIISQEVFEYRTVKKDPWSIALTY